MSIVSRVTDWVTTPYTIYLVLKDPSISRSVKMRSTIGLVLIFAYMVSPLDIIPDFIPLSGWMDDLVVAPLGLLLMRKFIPDIGIMEKRDRVHASVGKILFKVAVSLLIAALLAALWIGIIIFVIVRAIG